MARASSTSQLFRPPRSSCCNALLRFPCQAVVQLAIGQALSSYCCIYCPYSTYLMAHCSVHMFTWVLVAALLQAPRLTTAALRSCSSNKPNSHSACMVSAADTQAQSSCDWLAGSPQLPGPAEPSASVAAVPHAGTLPLQKALRAAELLLSAAARMRQPMLARIRCWNGAEAATCGQSLCTESPAVGQSRCRAVRPPAAARLQAGTSRRSAGAASQ